ARCLFDPGGPLDEVRISRGRYFDGPHHLLEPESSGAPAVRQRGWGFRVGDQRAYQANHGPAAADIAPTAEHRQSRFVAVGFASLAELPFAGQRRAGGVT